jgi:chromosome segregation ATPase
MQLEMAQLQVERDRSIKQLESTQSRLKDYAAQVASLEVALFSLNDKLAEALNYSNSVDVAYNDLRRSLT